MLTIDENKNILISSGDSASLTIDIDGAEITEKTKLVLAVKRTTSDAQEIIRKELTAKLNQTQFTFEFEKKDFENLNFGIYKYDISIINGENINTLMLPARFEISEVVRNV